MTSFLPYFLGLVVSVSSTDQPVLSRSPMVEHDMPVFSDHKWNAKAYDRINLTVEKGKKDAIKAHAESKGESVNHFINRAISETMEREGEG